MSDLNQEFVALARSIQLQRPVICDVGSRDGTEGIALLEQLEGERLHIFEPNPEGALLCRRKIDTLKNGLNRRISFNQLAVGDKQEVVPFLAVNVEESEEKDIGFSSFYPINPAYTRRRGRIVQKQILVDVTTLDCYFAACRHPDILWIDAEGAELKILKGATSVLEGLKLVHLEVSFRAMHIGKPLFWEIDRFLRQFDLEFLRFDEVSRLQGFLYRYRLLPNPPWRLNAVYASRALRLPSQYRNRSYPL